MRLRILRCSRDSSQATRICFLRYSLPRLGKISFRLKLIRDVTQTQNEHGGSHSYLVEEKICFAKLINNILQHDEEVKDLIPINPENDDVFHALEDGIILSKLINAGAVNTIDIRALNRKKNLNIY